MAKKPVYEVRRGIIVVRVWRERSRKSGRYSTSVVRLFRDGTVWQESARFDPPDISIVCLALDEAYTWMLLQTKELE
jgi:hypothetical protein